MGSSHFFSGWPLLAFFHHHHSRHLELGCCNCGTWKKPSLNVSRLRRSRKCKSTRRRVKLNSSRALIIGKSSSKRCGFYTHGLLLVLVLLVLLWNRRNCGSISRLCVEKHSTACLQLSRGSFIRTCIQTNTSTHGNSSAKRGNRANSNGQNSTCNCSSVARSCHHVRYHMLAHLHHLVVRS